MRQNTFSAVQYHWFFIYFILLRIQTFRNDLINAWILTVNFFNRPNKIQIYESLISVFCELLFWQNYNNTNDILDLLILSEWKWYVAYFHWHEQTYQNFFCLQWCNSNSNHDCSPSKDTPYCYYKIGYANFLSWPSPSFGQLI